MRISDWSSDVCSSDLVVPAEIVIAGADERSGTAAERLAAHGGPRRALAGEQASAQRCERFGRSEEHTSELQSLMRISYAVFCLKKKKRCNHTEQHNIS